MTRAPRPEPPDWTSLADEVLRGVHHALNNRLGSLGAMVEMLEAGELAHTAPAVEMMTGDLARVGECNRVLQLLPHDAHAGEEPLMLDDVLVDVFAIHKYLHDTRDIDVAYERASGVEPVRCERWALLRVLTLLLAAAKRDAQRHGGTGDGRVVVRVASGEGYASVAFSVDGPEPTDIAECDVRYVERLAAGFGGEISRRPGAAALRLPTLTARRAAPRARPAKPAASRR